MKIGESMELIKPSIETLGHNHTVTSNPVLSSGFIGSANMYLFGCAMCHQVNAASSHKIAFLCWQKSVSNLKQKRTCNLPAPVGELWQSNQGHLDLIVKTVCVVSWQVIHVKPLNAARDVLRSLRLKCCVGRSPKSHPAPRGLASARISDRKWSERQHLPYLQNQQQLNHIIVCVYYDWICNNVSTICQDICNFPLLSRSIYIMSYIMCTFLPHAKKKRLDDFAHRFPGTFFHAVRVRV